MTTRAAIAADSLLTVAAGARIAACGGNAVDIAVAAALAASLAEILMCSLGGSAFVMLQRADGAAELIDRADAVPTGHLRGPLGPEACWQVDLPYGDGITVRAGPAALEPHLIRGFFANPHLRYITA